jgi:hypothetical protein
MANNKDFIIKNALEVGKDTKTTLGTITSSDVDLSTGNYFADTLSANTTYTFSNAGDVQAFQMEVTGSTVPYDISDASYDGKSFSVQTQQGNAQGIFFKSDGTKLYVSGTSQDTVSEYDLSTAWDISTASHLQDFSVASQEANVKALFLSPDGLKMYVMGASGIDVNEYTLSTAWDISTASYVGVFSISAQEVTPTGLFFKSDGTKMYVLGSNGDDVNEYNLSTAWSISTASYSQNFSVASQDNEPTDLFFSSDGTRMVIVGDTNNTVYLYNLSTGWDVSTASFSHSFSVASQTTTPQAVHMGSDGDKLYVCGNSYIIYQYSTTTTTLTWPSSVEWTAGLAPSAPGFGETDVYTFVTDDGGTSYVGLQTADNLS